MSNTTKPHKATALKQKKQSLKKSPKSKALKQCQQGTNFRSKFEATIAATLNANKIPFDYEKIDLEYCIIGSYKPDFIFKNFIVEAKGYFSPEDRRKMLAVKEKHPSLDIRFCFQNAKTKLSRGKKRSLTYAQWAERHGFLWSHGSIPEEWYL